MLAREPHFQLNPGRTSLLQLLEAVGTPWLVASWLRFVSSLCLLLIRTLLSPWMIQANPVSRALTQAHLQSPFYRFMFPAPGMRTYYLSGPSEVGLDLITEERNDGIQINGIVKRGHCMSQRRKIPKVKRFCQRIPSLLCPNSRQFLRKQGCPSGQHGWFSRKGAGWKEARGLSGSLCHEGITLNQCKAEVRAPNSCEDLMVAVSPHRGSCPFLLLPSPPSHLWRACFRAGVIPATNTMGSYIHPRWCLPPQPPVPGSEPDGPQERRLRP